ncbi:stage III sporulation protein AF [Clostridium sp.]|uniref:stage III sporulation protein AF n=1 Tax=Clostridium sp. TaxID=1506 RepID=UPI002A91B606|nr:stage III sporulation protein AF [Clostridium sp.]MDY6011795.1 stage III sporulation protein AF [Clostridium sp.]
MELLNKFVITLVTTLIFMTAVELIAPDNSMKKYLKFVLGLILITVILNPILTIILNGEQELKDVISGYEEEYNVNKKDNESTENIMKIKEDSFKDNFNKNCESMLKQEFKDLEFKCNVDCVVDFNDNDFTINKLSIQIKDKKVKKVEKIDKVDINSKKDKKDTVNKEYKDVVKFISKELNIDENKIDIYKIE